MGKEYQRDINVISAPDVAVEPMLVTDFSHHYWYRAYGTAGFAVERDPRRMASGLASLRLITKSSPAIGNYVAQGFFPPTSERRYREHIITFCPTAVTVTDGIIVFDVFVVDWNVGLEYYFSVRLDLLNSVIQIQTAAGVWTTVATMPARLIQNAWVTFCFVIDTMNLQWHSLKLQNWDIDVSNYTYFGSAGGNISDYLFIGLYCGTTNQLEMWVDKVVVQGTDIVP